MKKLLSMFLALSLVLNFIPLSMVYATANPALKSLEISTGSLAGNLGPRITIGTNGESVTAQLTATGTYDNGGTKDVTNDVTWKLVANVSVSSPDYKGVTISDSGLLTVTKEVVVSSIYVQVEKDGVKSEKKRISISNNYDSSIGGGSGGIGGEVEIKPALKLSSVEIIGDSTVAIPKEGEVSNSLEFTLQGKDQNGDNYDIGTYVTTWRITNSPAPTGVDIDLKGKLTVNSSASVGTVYVQVSVTNDLTYEVITATKTISITRAESIASKINVTLDKTTVDVPTAGQSSPIINATATVYDQYDEEMRGQTVEWSVKNNPTGVSIDEKGIITVKNTAEADDNVYIVGSIGKVSGSASLDINKGTVVISEIRINKEGNEKIIIPTSGSAVEKTYTANVLDNYGVVKESTTATWSAENIPNGVTVEGNKVTVSPDAVVGTFKLTATASGNVKDTITITLKEKEVANITGLDNDTIEYDGNSYTPSATVNQSGNITYTYTKDGEKVDVIKDAGTYTVNATFENDTHYGTATVTVTVTPRPVTISGVTASDRVYDGTTSVELVGGISNGIIDKKGVEVTLGEGTISDKNVGTAKPVTTNITLTGEKSSNYSLSQPSGITVDITAKALTLTAPTIAPTKVYDANTTCGDISFDVQGFVSGESGTMTASAAYADKNVGTNKDITLSNEVISGVNLSNYSYTLPILKGSITAKEISIAIEGETSVKYGESFTHTASASLLDTDTATYTVLYNGESTKPTNAGDYTLTATIDNDNYTINNTTGVTNFEITKITPTISSVTQNIVYDDSEIKTVSLDDFGVEIAAGTLVVETIADNILETITGGDTISYQLSSENTVSNIGETATINVTFNPTDSTNYESVRTTLTISLVGKNIVSFNSNGGTSVNTQNIADDDYVVAPVAPTKESTAQFSYSFDGWYTSDDNGVTLSESEFDFVNTPITDDITLYAKWTKSTNQYTVTFKDYDGKELAKQTVDYGTKATKPDNPTRVGYKFLNWDKEFDNVVRDIVVIAKYEILIEDLDIDDLDTNTDTGKENINNAASEVVKVENTTIIKDKVLLDKVNTLDDKFITANNIDVSVETTPLEGINAEDKLAIPTTIVKPKGLALAIFGADTTNAPNVTVKLKMKQKDPTTEKPEDDLAVLVDVKPYKGNDKFTGTLGAPVTFRIYLPESFDENAKQVELYHYPSNGGATEKQILPILNDTDNGNARYVEPTFTHFSDVGLKAITPTSVDAKPETVTDTHNVVVAVSEGGKVTPSIVNNNIVTLNAGGSQEFTFTPDAGYIVEGVFVDGEFIGATNKYTFSNISADHELKVIFKAIGVAHANPNTGVMLK